MHRGNRGFTTVELVVVIVLLGILTAYAAPKFAGRGGYSELTARQEIKQTIRFAQQLAMSRTDRTISFVIILSTPNQIDIRQDGVSLGLNYSYPKKMSDDISLGTATTLTFNRFGATSDATISVTGPLNQAQNICVVGITGYAQDC